MGCPPPPVTHSIPTACSPRCSPAHCRKRPPPPCMASQQLLTKMGRVSPTTAYPTTTSHNDCLQKPTCGDSSLPRDTDHSKAQHQSGRLLALGVSKMGTSPPPHLVVTSKKMQEGSLWSSQRLPPGKPLPPVQSCQGPERALCHWALQGRLDLHFPGAWDVGRERKGHRVPTEELPFRMRYT